MCVCKLGCHYLFCTVCLYYCSFCEGRLETSVFVPALISILNPMVFRAFNIFFINLSNLGPLGSLMRISLSSLYRPMSFFSRILARHERMSMATNSHVLLHHSYPLLHQIGHDIVTLGYMFLRSSEKLVYFLNNGSIYAW